MSFKTIEWCDDHIKMINQKKLPNVEEYVTCTTYEDVYVAIKDMIIRGAPAIGVAAAFGIALGVKKIKTKNEFNVIVDRISSARPTAVNLFWACERMKRLFTKSAEKDLNEIKKILENEAKKIYAEDIEINKKMGENGSKLLSSGDTILTHCNAGALATAGFGTALGVIRAAVNHGKKIHVYADETRPFLQGARLTCWELAKDNIPVTLICDNMAGHFMKQGKINKIIVGADRIAANGDTANKIGTYTVAALAKENKIPFYVAAPLSTIDINTKTGEDILIEERNHEEVTKIEGIRIAPENIDVKNPAFDVTPNELIAAIITEKGILNHPYYENIDKIIDN